MTLLDDRPTIAAPESSNGPLVNPEALFKEARQRRRRRWGLGAGSIALLVVALCVVVVSGGMGGGSDHASEANAKGPGSPLLSRSAGSFQAVGNGILASALPTALPSPSASLLSIPNLEMPCMTGGRSPAFWSPRRRMAEHRGCGFAASPIDGVLSL